MWMRWFYRARTNGVQLMPWRLVALLNVNNFKVLHPFLFFIFELLFVCLPSLKTKKTTTANYYHYYCFH